MLIIGLLILSLPATPAWALRQQQDLHVGLEEALALSAGLEKKFARPDEALTYLLLQPVPPDSFLEGMYQLGREGRLVDEQGNSLPETQWISFGFLGSAADHFRSAAGVSAGREFLQALQQRIPSPVDDATESALLRALLAYGKPADITWNDMSKLASVAHEGWVPVSGKSLYYAASALDHFGDSPRLSRRSFETAKRYSIKWRPSLHVLAGHYFDGLSDLYPSRDGMAAYFLGLALEVRLPKSLRGPQRVDSKGTPLFGLAPSSYLLYFPVLAHELFLPWLVEDEARRIGISLLAAAQVPDETVFAFSPSHWEDGLRLMELLDQVSTRVSSCRNKVIMVGYPAHEYLEKSRRPHPALLFAAKDLNDFTRRLSDYSILKIHYVATPKEVQGLTAALQEQGAQTQVMGISAGSLEGVLNHILSILGGIDLNAPREILEGRCGVSLQELSEQLKTLVQIGA